MHKGSRVSKYPLVSYRTLESVRTFCRLRCLQRGKKLSILDFHTLLWHICLWVTKMGFQMSWSALQSLCSTTKAQTQHCSYSGSSLINCCLKFIWEITLLPFLWAENSCIQSSFGGTQQVAPAACGSGISLRCPGV